VPRELVTRRPTNERIIGLSSATKRSAAAE
jgi:hypothetical protein